VSNLSESNCLFSQKIDLKDRTGTLLGNFLHSGAEIDRGTEIRPQRPLQISLESDKNTLNFQKPANQQREAMPCLTCLNYPS